MELVYFINLIFIFVINILFLFLGICLNSLVIVSFWRSVQFRKKLCYFTIMVLSCCDLLVVLTNHPMTALRAMLWLTERMKKYPTWLVISQQLLSMMIGVSLHALFVMNVDRYLATNYPLYHRTSVTKRKLLTFFTVLIIIQIAVTAISTNDLIISYQLRLLIFFVIFIPPMLFINYRLFKIARKSRRNNEISPEMKKSFSFKKISNCLMVVACVIVLSILSFVYIGLRLTSKQTEFPLNNTRIAGLWITTTASMNSTCNCLIFYWRDKTLRAEGMKVIKSMKICRRGQS